METKGMTLQASRQGRSLKGWLNKENKLFTALVGEGEKVTNKQTLLALNACIALTALLLLSASLPAMLICTAWFALSIYSCKKGGMGND